MIRAGTARRIMNNELGTYVQGATYINRVEYIRDDLEANGLYLESGECGLLFITLDIGAIGLDYVERILPDIAAAAGVPAERILIGCSHTHSAPTTIETRPEKPIDEPYHERLREWLCEIGSEAVSSARPVMVAWGKGRAEIGYNRRVCTSHGAHYMHGDPTHPDSTGLEGGTDPQHTALFVRDMDGKLMAILHHNTAHPVNFYGANFLSADFPGLARKYLREVLGDIEILFFNGALGDISIYDEFWKGLSPETAEQRVARAAHLMTGETLRLLQHADYKDQIAIGHAKTRYDVELRPLTAEGLAEATQAVDAYPSDPTKPWDLAITTAYMTLLFHKQFGDRKTETIDLHAGYIDGLSFVSVPCELFTHFAVQAKRRSPFPATIMLGLTNGDMGYCPTIEGEMGGSWEGTVKLTSRWHQKAGYLIVDEWCRMLHELRPS